MTPERPTVAVVGGGMAGLAAAWQLTRCGGGGDAPRVVVLEAGACPGGKVRSTEFGGRTVDLAADAFLARRPEATELCAELGLEGALVAPGASGASLWARGRLRMMPAGMNLGVPTRWLPLVRSGILGLSGVARCALDLALPHPGSGTEPEDRAVGPVVAARLGHQVVDRLVDPLVGGIHAGGVEELSARATFPALIEADRRAGSLMRRLALPAPPPHRPDDGDGPAPVFWSLDRGVGRLPLELATAVATGGATVCTGVSVDALTRPPPGTAGGRWRLVMSGDTATVPGADVGADGARVLDVDGVVLAVPAQQAADLLTGHAQDAAALLREIGYASVTVVTLSIPAGAVRSELAGTGFLVPRTSPIGGRTALITGCTYLSRKWPALARPGEELIRLSVGRYGDVRADSLDDDELCAAAFGEFATILDIAGQPTDSLVTRWNGAFPQYQVGHVERADRIERSVAGVPGLAIAGAALRGVGIPAVIGTGRSAARALLASLEGAPPAAAR
ncbi:MAG TPA: protoporphyrinogen oxidase [Acidimicrobiales bacterium]|nr:protoporphyrinogen oxidase [Acidimicrobiales bacterium]